MAYFLGLKYPLSTDRGLKSGTDGLQRWRYNSIDGLHQQHQPLKQV